MTFEIIDFPYTDTTAYFNSSILEYNNRTLMFVRKGILEENARFYRSSICCWDERSLFDLTLPTDSSEQIEDPRPFVYNDRIHLNCDVFDYIKTVQKTFILNEDLSFNSLLDSKVPHLQTWEKNWTHFKDSDNQLYCVYSLTPYVVYNVATGEKVLDVNYNWNWKHGRVSGGSNPTFVDGLFYSFFHSSEIITPYERIYYVGFYSFKPQFPFDIVSYSKNPILVGDKKYGIIKGYLYANQVMFPVGCVFKNGMFEVSIGVNDYKTAVLKLSLDELKQYE